MPCLICKHGTPGPGTTTITLTRGDTTLVFRQVPARVCDTCGEALLDLETARALEATAEQAIANGVRHEVRDYVQKAVA